MKRGKTKHNSEAPKANWKLRISEAPNILLGNSQSVSFCTFIFFSCPSQFSKENFSFISGLGDKIFDATHPGTKLGERVGSH